MQNNNTDFRTSNQLHKLMCNHINIVKYEQSPPLAVNANSVLRPCTGSDTLEEKLKEKQEVGKGRQQDDLSLPADAESAPWAPSQLPGQFTSCKMD